MAKRVLTTGLWCVEASGEFQWFWLSLKTGKAWQQFVENGRVMWSLRCDTSSQVRGLAEALKLHEGSLVPAEDKEAWDKAVEAAGGIPHYVMDGAKDSAGLPISFDTADGWELEGLSRGIISRPIASPDDDVAAEFLGCEPEKVKAITQEFAQIPANEPVKPAKVSVKSSVVPIGSNTCAELEALGVKPKRFGKLHHRVAYVAVANGSVVVAWKQGYKRGSDKHEEQRMLDYLKPYGVMALAA